jgi:branched-chain amino acid transport system permease protein
MYLRERYVESSAIWLQLLPSTLADGLSLGVMYAIIALGYTLVYGVLGLINFAHSEVFMVGGIVGVEVLLYVTAPFGWHPLIQLCIALLAGGFVAALVAWGVERLAYRPLRSRSAGGSLAPLITGIGVSLVLMDTVRLVESFFGHFERPFPDFPWFNEVLSLTPWLSLSYKSIVIWIFGAFLLSILVVLVQKTRWGLALRAVAQDAQAATLLGIKSQNMVVFAFVLGGFLGGMGGVLFALQFGKMDPFAGFIPGMKAFTAAVLGGIGSISGAMLGGILLGILEVLAGTYLPMLTQGVIGNEYRDSVAFFILILVLLWCPSGLLGKAKVDKV